MRALDCLAVFDGRPDHLAFVIETHRISVLWQIHLQLIHQVFGKLWAVDE